MSTSFTTTLKSKLNLGKLVITIGARDALVEAGETPYTFLQLHQLGDKTGSQAADTTIKPNTALQGSNFISKFTTAKGQKIMVITEENHETTVVLLQKELETKTIGR